MAWTGASRFSTGRAIAPVEAPPPLVPALLDELLDVLVEVLVDVSVDVLVDALSSLVDVSLSSFWVGLVMLEELEEELEV